MAAQEQSKAIIVGLTAILAVVIAVVLSAPAATGYEVSIYNTYSLSIWLAFGVVLVGGVLLILAGGRERTSIWLPGFALILGAYGVFYSLPLVRGYVLYGSLLSDSLYHLSIVSDVISTGELPQLLYPFTHTLFAELALLTGLSPNVFQMPVSYAFTVLFMIGYFVSARRLFSNQGGIYVLASAVPLTYTGLQLTILPWFYALCVIPLVVFALQLQTRAKVALVAFPLATAIVFYHPLTSLFIIIIAGIYHIWSSWNPHTPAARGGTVALAAGITVLVWSLDTSRVQALLVQTVLGVATEEGVSTYAAQAVSSEYTISQLLVEYVILRWGPLMLFLGVASLIVVAIAYQCIRERRISTAGMLGIQYLTAGIVGVVLIGVGITSRSLVRLSQFALFFSTYLVGFGLWRTVRHKIGQQPHRRVTTIIGSGLVLVVLVSTVLSAGIAYEDNKHITETTVEGTDWHLTNHDSSLQTKSFRMSYQIQLYLQGYTAGHEAPRTFSRYSSVYQLPTNLGYDDNATMAQTLQNRSYLITKVSDIAWARGQPTVNDRPHQYSRANQATLADDRTVNKLYSNGAFDIWLAASKGTRR